MAIVIIIIVLFSYEYVGRDNNNRFFLKIILCMQHKDMLAYAIYKQKTIKLNFII